VARAGERPVGYTGTLTVGGGDNLDDRLTVFLGAAPTWFTGAAVSQGGQVTWLRGEFAGLLLAAGGPVVVQGQTAGVPTALRGTDFTVLVFPASGYQLSLDGQGGQLTVHVAAPGIRTEQDYAGGHGGEIDVHFPYPGLTSYLAYQDLTG
jgi:hypothetical protein